MGMKATFILKQIQNSIQFKGRGGGEEKKKGTKNPQAFKMPSLM